MRLHCGVGGRQPDFSSAHGQLQSDPEAHILGSSTHRSGKRRLNLYIIPSVRFRSSQAQCHLISWSIGVQQTMLLWEVAHRDAWVIFQVLSDAPEIMDHRDAPCGAGGLPVPHRTA